MKVEIKSVSGRVIYSSEATSLKECLENAVKDSANLSYADLSDADLSYANLSYANLSDADLSYANLRGANLIGANLSYADLSGANLSDADLRGANLSDADLSYADLSGANLSDADLRGANGEKIFIQKTPIQVDGLKYWIIIFDNHMKIGCELHKISEWSSFDNRKIIEMDGRDALKWWKNWKEPLMAICKAKGRS